MWTFCVHVSKRSQKWTLTDTLKSLFTQWHWFCQIKVIIHLFLWLYIRRHRFSLYDISQQSVWSSGQNWFYSSELSLTLKNVWSCSNINFKHKSIFKKEIKDEVLKQSSFRAFNVHILYGFAFWCLGTNSTIFIT